MGRSLTMGAVRPAAAKLIGGPCGGPWPGGGRPPPPPVVTETECGASWGVVECACCTGRLP